MKRRLLSTSIVAALAASVLLSLAGSALAYSNDFESGTTGWETFAGNTVTQVANGYVNPAGYASPIDSAGGTNHARLGRGTCTEAPSPGGPFVNCYGPYTYWGDGNNNVWNGPYSTQVDVYLDTAYANANPDTYGGNYAGLTTPDPSTDPADKGTRFDFTSAINSSAPLDSNGEAQHLRDFGFNVSTGYATDGCAGFMITGQTNVNRNSANPNIGGHSPQCIAQPGWYTFKHSFSDEGGFLKVAMEVIPVSGGPAAASWTITGIDPSGTFGCNRYGWFANQEINGLPIDNAKITGGCDPTPPPTTGTWTQHGSHSTTYQAAVQQPINTANTSNWNSKSKGAIPVMFKLSSATGPTLFQSIGSDTSTANDYSYLKFTPDAPMTFADFYKLSAEFEYTLGDSHGGSLRWQVNTASGNLFIYYGAAPNWTGVGGSGVNMIGQPELRYDTTQLGGSFYDTYANALTLLGTTPVTSVQLTLDSGWGGDQRATISNITVNDNVQQWDAGGIGDFAPTCDLPTATIEVGKNDPVVSGDVNEAAVQASLADDGNAFRVVDCKYQYILSIPSLQGKGTYEVQIWIGGVRVPTPGSPDGHVKFDIK